MPVRKRNMSKRSALDEPARLWLDGDERCGFYKFRTQEQLAAVWRDHGEEEKMFWRSRYHLPIPREELEAHEDDWLDGAGYTVVNHYTDDEKQVLWNKRGDKARFDWQPGMRMPAPIEKRLPQ